MRKALFATAMTVAVLGASPAFAQATGYVGAAVNWGEVQVAGEEANGEGYTLSSAVSAPIGAALSVQADAAYADSFDNDDVDGVLSGSAHLVGNLGEDMRLGAFVTAADVADETALGGGVEGQVNFERSTLAGTAAYATVDELDIDAWGLSGEYRFFATDNFRIDGSLSWASIQTPIGDTEAWGAGLGGEFKPADSMFSVFGGWNYTEADELDVAANAFALGVRVNFGGSLMDRDRSGPSFNGAGSLLSLANF
jgi:hypothetical protein